MKGVMPSVLGKDGYNPSAIQFDGTAPPSAPSAPSSSTNAVKAHVAAAVIAKPVTSQSKPIPKARYVYYCI